MPRNLDLTALRSFVAVADAGGVTRAAGFLNLTQSAVSMQLKRLEESLDLQLLDRSSRKIALTASGEQMLGYARKMLALNDEVYARLTHQAFEGEVVLGVPHDIVYPAIPQVLRRFHIDYPRVKVQLVSSFTRNLKEQFGRGECDMILTTESGCDAGGETVATLPLVWIGAQGGTAWKQRPLRLAFERRCIFRQGVQAALNRAGIPWEMAIESDQSRPIEASVSADLAVHVMIEGTAMHESEPIQHGGALPDLGAVNINLYLADGTKNQMIDDMAALIRQSFVTRLVQAVA
ncbi:MAG: LysR family transcriptional regulator [Paracoccaceae bacterium]